MNKMEPSILYQDKDILAIDKPAGLVVHPSGRAEVHPRVSNVGDRKTEEPTLTDWIMKNYPDSADVGEPGRTSDGKIISRPGIVHRLDKETSGVMLIAKTKEGFESLKIQFQKHEVIKEYRAFVYGNMKADNGLIDRPIGRSKKDFRQWSAQRGARGEMREAVTEYEVKQKTKKYSFVSVFPKTGRTHQIRVHFKAINYPLVADSLYAPDRENALGFERLALHSYRITFKNLKGKNETVTAPYPADFLRAELLMSQ